LGDAPVEAIARTIATSVGPSGPNRVYFSNLLDAMRQMSARVGHDCVDDHLLAIEAALATWA